MDRYDIYGSDNYLNKYNFTVVIRSNGEWVKYSDVEALQARVRELELMVEQRDSRRERELEREKQVVAQRDSLLQNTIQLENRVRELEKTLREVREELDSDDNTRQYIDEMLKGTHDER